MDIIRAKSRANRITAPLTSGAGAYINIAALFVSATNTFAVTANRLYGVPFYLPRPYTVGKFWCNITGSAAGNAQLGIYNLDQDLATITTLAVKTTANVDVSSTGVKSGACTATPLIAGWYLLAAQFSGTPTVTGVAANNLLSNFGFLSASFTKGLGAYRDVGSFGLPADETGQTYTNAAGINLPIIGYSTQ